MIGISIASLSPAALSLMVYADDAAAARECTADMLFCNPIKYYSVGELLLGLTNSVTIVLMPIIVLCIVYIGFRMVLAGRERNADYKKWKDAFMWSLVGLFLVLGARGILYVIQNTVNDLLDDDYKTDVIEKQEDV